MNAYDENEKRSKEQTLRCRVSGQNLHPTRLLNNSNQSLIIKNIVKKQKLNFISNEKSSQEIASNCFFTG